MIILQFRFCLALVEGDIVDIVSELAAIFEDLKISISSSPLMVLLKFAMCACMHEYEGE